MKVTLSKDKKMLTIELPLHEPKPSASGKTQVIGSTQGNKPTEATYDGKVIVVGANAYFKP